MSHIQTDARAVALALSQKKAVQKHRDLKVARVASYDANPTVCERCSQAIKYKRRNNRFCSRSCSASIIQLGLIKKETTKIKIGATQKAITSEGRRSKRKQFSQSFCAVYFKTCVGCQRLFYTRALGKWGRKTCSAFCAINRTNAHPYVNSKRKTYRYFNKNTQDFVILESSWEFVIAEYLDQHVIIWTRPKPISWSDTAGKLHLYYADFYLPSYDVYLDPKNPWCMARDKSKMLAVSKFITVIHGSLDIVTQGIDTLIKSFVQIFPP